MEKNLKKLLLLISIFILIAINIWIFISNTTKKNYNAKAIPMVNETQLKEQNAFVSEKEMEDKINTKVTSMDEISRAKVYCGRFIETIENKEYQKAYSYLNAAYKANYFPTLEEFSTYMQNKYPKNGIIIKYNSVDKKGEVFVLDITVYDEDDADFIAFNQSVIIREIEANNFSVSFSKDDERSGRSR